LTTEGQPNYFSGVHRSAAAVLLPQCCHDNDAILLPRCLHRAASTELIPPSCFHRAASTELLPPSCFHRAASTALLLLLLYSSCRRAGVSTDDAALPVLLMQPACGVADAARLSHRPHLSNSAIRSKE